MVYTSGLGVSVTSLHLVIYLVMTIVIGMSPFAIVLLAFSTMFHKFVTNTVLSFDENVTVIQIALTDFTDASSIISRFFRMNYHMVSM